MKNIRGILDEFDSDYNDAFRDLSGRLIVSTSLEDMEGIISEMQYDIDQDGELMEIRGIAIGPEEKDGHFSDVLSVNGWLEEIFDGFEFCVPATLEVGVAENLHEIHSEQPMEISDGIRILAQIYERILECSPVDVVFSAVDGKTDVVNKMPFEPESLIIHIENGNPVAEYDPSNVSIKPLDITEVKFPVANPEKGEMSYEDALARHPKEVAKVVEDLRNSSSKFKDVDPKHLIFEYHKVTGIRAYSAEDIFIHRKHIKVEETLDDKLEEYVKNTSVTLYGRLKNFSSGVKLETIPQQFIDKKRQQLIEEEERQQQIDNQSPEERLKSVQDSISKLQAMGGFSMFGMPPTKETFAPKDEIIHKKDGTVIVKKVDGTEEQIGTVESIGRGQYMATFGELDDFVFPSFESAAYWMEDCYLSKIGDGQFYKFQMALKRRRDKNFLG